MNKTLEYLLTKDIKEDLDKWKNKIIFLDRKTKVLIFLRLICNFYNFSLSVYKTKHMHISQMNNKGYVYKKMRIVRKTLKKKNSRG